MVGLMVQCFRLSTVARPGESVGKKWAADSDRMDVWPIERTYASQFSKGEAVGPITKILLADKPRKRNTIYAINAPRPEPTIPTFLVGGWADIWFISWFFCIDSLTEYYTHLM